MINKTEQEIMENWTSIETPLVSICALAYNHEKYIEDAMDGMLMQETTFPFEIIVHDDASTDNTANIIKKYAEKFPNIVRPILQTENQYSKKTRSVGSFVYEKSRGKYLALCECDDYWTDSSKLQSQINLLEQNNDISLVFHNAIIHEYNENGEIIDSRKHTNGLKTGFVTIHQVLLENKIIPTASVVFKKVNFGEFLDPNFPVGDTPTFMYLAKFGKLYYVDEVTSVYRSLTTGAGKFQRGNIEKNIQYFPYYKALQNEFSEFELNDLMEKLLARRCEIIIKLGVKQKKYWYVVKYFIILLVSYPKYFGSFIGKYLSLTKKSKS